MNVEIVLLVALACVNADHLIVGNVANGVQLAKHELVEYNAIPFIKRVKYYFYSGPNTMPIQGIKVTDMLHKNGSVIITAGGLGLPYVNLRMKSERSHGLSYDICIYVMETGH